MQRLAVIPRRVVRRPWISVRKVGPKSVAGLGALSPALVQAKRLGCKSGAEYTSKGWRCREQNPAVQKLKKYQDALRLKALAKKMAPKAKTTLRASLQRAAKLASAKRQAAPATETIKIGNIKVAPIPIDPGKDVAVVTANEESLVTTSESEDEGGIGFGTLLAGAAAVAAVGGIAYLLLRNKGGAPAAPARTSAKRSTRRSSPRSTQRSSSRSTLPSGTAVMPNRSGTTKQGRWWLYSADSGNYLLTTKHHGGGSVPIVIDDVTYGSAKRLGQVTAPWPRYASQADDLVQQVRGRTNPSKRRGSKKARRRSPSKRKAELPRERIQHGIDLFESKYGRRQLEDLGAAAASVGLDLNSFFRMVVKSPEIARDLKFLKKKGLSAREASVALQTALFRDL